MHSITNESSGTCDLFGLGQILSQMLCSYGNFGATVSTSKQVTENFCRRWILLFYVNEISNLNFPLKRIYKIFYRSFGVFKRQYGASDRGSGAVNSPWFGGHLRISTTNRRGKQSSARRSGHCVFIGLGQWSPAGRTWGLIKSGHLLSHWCSSLEDPGGDRMRRIGGLLRVRSLGGDGRSGSSSRRCPRQSRHLGRIGLCGRLQFWQRRIWRGWRFGHFN